MKIVVAYSGGLDTSVLLTWLKETYGAEIVAFCADIGQQEELDGLEAKALATGASLCQIDDLRGYNRVLSPGQMTDLPAGVQSIGFGGDGFCFDNEGPAHQVFIGAVQPLQHPLLGDREVRDHAAEDGAVHR